MVSFKAAICLFGSIHLLWNSPESAIFRPEVTWDAEGAGFFSLDPPNGLRAPPEP